MNFSNKKVSVFLAYAGRQQHFVVTYPGGLTFTLLGDNVRELAPIFLAEGIQPDEIEVGDWRDGDHVMGSGEKIALFWEMRQLARK